MACNPREAALALHRFGFGPRAGSIEAIADDPRGALLAELDRPNVGQIANATLPSSSAANRAVFEYNAERNANDKRERLRREAAAQVAMQSAGGDATMEAKPDAVPAASAQPEAVPLPRQLFRNEARARFDAAINAEIGLVERLVWFWSNHFCVNADATVMAGGYEREAIRPHVLGRFSDMLLAVEGHPAMLFYLNNEQSIGPGSVAGINRDKGLNENLAREILELHTLGVRTVYTQSDVTNFAKVLTGWTILPTVTNPDHGGEFVFLRRAHEPGARTVIGNAYADGGVEQGPRCSPIWRVTRRPPSTWRPSWRVTLSPTNRRRRWSMGSRNVSSTPTAISKRWSQRWSQRPNPGRPSREDKTAERMDRGSVAGDRGIRRNSSHSRGRNLLGEPLWRPPAPKGFSDENAAWLDGLGRRLEIANGFAHRDGLGHDPEAVMETAIGPLASAETRRAIAGAESRPQALTLLLMAPEFQRR